MIIDKRIGLSSGITADHPRKPKARSTLATMSQQHRRSNRQLCCLLLRKKVACCFDNVAVLGNNVEATLDLVERTKFQRKTRSTLLPFFSTLLLVWTGLKSVAYTPDTSLHRPSAGSSRNTGAEMNLYDQDHLRTKLKWIYVYSHSYSSTKSVLFENHQSLFSVRCTLSLE